MPIRRRKGIMIIDDEPYRRKRIYDVLKLTGEDIYSATTGTQAMERLPREKPQMVIVNVESPEVAGIQFIRDLRTYGMGQRMKVLGVVTEDSEYRTMAASAGADECMDATIAPFEMLELVAGQLEIDHIEIPKEQMTKRKEIVEEVVKNYKARTDEAKRSKDKALGVRLFLPGRVEPLLALTDFAGKGRA